MMDIISTGKRAKSASRRIAAASTEQKNAAIGRMAHLLALNKKRLAGANRKDIEAGRKAGLPANLLGRLVFDEARVDSRIQSLHKIIDLPDPVGQIGEMERRPNGLMVGRMRVPIGVILMIYEARPHVTVNAGAFALKSGNAIVLKGGSEARHCNAMIGRLWVEALSRAGLPAASVQCIEADHEEVAGMLQLTEYIDLVIPRGGKGLIRSVVNQSKIPVIKHFEGICHVYIDDDADMNKAARITLNSKLLMPGVCNAAETLLISEKKGAGVPRMVRLLKQAGVEVRGCEKTRSLARGVRPASEEDWRTEYLDKILAVRIVKGIGEAIEHINTYGSGHTDSIVTENYTHANRFLREVDSGVVLVNASTMFDDGEELGMGAEIGISTDKLHARGPMGLRELTTYKFVVLGEDHIKEA
jgi:glutamate-5-semialdehyde dehydrogenase